MTAAMMSLVNRVPLGQPSPSDNLAPTDRWTAVHAATGAAAALVGMPFRWFLGLSTLYEIVEYAHEWPRGSRIFGSKRPESLTNVAADVVVNVAGYAVGRGISALLR